MDKLALETFAELICVHGDVCHTVGPALCHRMKYPDSYFNEFSSYNLV